MVSFERRLRQLLPDWLVMDSHTGLDHAFLKVRPSFHFNFNSFRR